jgi:hypothetical protein
LLSNERQSSAQSWLARQPAVLLALPSAMPNSAGRSLEAVEVVEVLDSLPGDLLELFQPVEADNG